MQRTIIFLVVLLLTATACGGGENTDEREVVPALLPTLAGEEDEAEESPRVATTPDSRVPATWTPSSPRPAAMPVATGTVASPAAEGNTVQPDGGVQPAEGGDRYVVRAGDTLAELAQEFGVELEVLAQANNIDDIDHIEVGQELVIPR